MKTVFIAGMILFTSLLLSACASTSGANPSSQQEGSTAEQRETAIPSGGESSPTAQPPGEMQETTSTASPEVAPTQSSPATLFSEESPPRGAALEFSTDFNKHTIPYSEILSGGPPKDGIPAIDEPVFVDVDEANSWLKPVEPVILVEVGEEARAYPLQILIWHEIVNDTISDLPLVVTFCPLCNTAIAFKRTFNG